MAWSTPGKYSSFVPRVSRTSHFTICLSPLPFAEPRITHISIYSIYQFIFIRIAPARTKVFKYEPFLIAVVLFYGAFFWFGSKANYTKANTWFVASFYFILFFILPCSTVLWGARSYR